MVTSPERAAASAVADAFLSEVGKTAAIPLPGSGDTPARFRYLAEVAGRSLPLGRLIEGHLDAVAILAEAGRERPAGAAMGVWAASGRDARLLATPAAGGWRLAGRKPYASGASTLTHALVTADTPDGVRLFLLETANVVGSVLGSWQAVGMWESDSPTVEIDAHVAESATVGGVDWYVRRPGFWHGSVGVAACWLGGARAVARPLSRAASPHALAHLGAVDSALAAAAALLTAAAVEIDDVPSVVGPVAERRALRVRSVVEVAAMEAITRVGRALGAGPLCHDAEHAQRVADLSVYVRQGHAERDYERLGQLVVEQS